MVPDALPNLIHSFRGELAAIGALKNSFVSLLETVKVGHHRLAGSNQTPAIHRIVANPNDKSEKCAK